MNHPLTGSELFQGSMAHLRDVIDPPSPDMRGDGDEDTFTRIAQVYAVNANTAILVTIADLIAKATGQRNADLEEWAEVIGSAPLKECWGKETRRPACAERHTDDCLYTDPVPEPKHVLIDVGTRVLVPDPHQANCGCGTAQPFVGKIAGYDMSRSKYQINEEVYGRPGEYYRFVKWVFADNRVQVHPDGPASVPSPEPVKQEPTGPRIYVQNHHGQQGHIIAIVPLEGEDDVTQAEVQWYAPGAQPCRERLNHLQIITADKVERCPSGQTRDECDEGENRCELCLADEDDEAARIERSMNL